MPHQKGHIPWNKGLTKEINESLRRMAKSKIGKPLSEETIKKISLSLKLKTPWNKGIYGFKKKPLTEEQKRNVSLGMKKFYALGGKSTINKVWGDKNSEWKGDRVGYRALHKWVERELGRPTDCKNCGKLGLTGHQIHWANISGEYKRDLTDWIRLCTFCHRKQGVSIGKSKRICKINGRLQLRNV